MTRSRSTTPATGQRRTLHRSLVAAGLAAVAGAGVVASSGTALAGGEPATGSAATDLERSIVQIGTEWTGYVQYPTRTGPVWSDAVHVEFSCTGWFASDEGHIVTAGHCVDPADPRIREALLEQFLAERGASDRAAEAADWPVEGLESVLPDRSAVWAVQPFEVEGSTLHEETVVQVLDYRSFEDGDVALLQASGLGEPTPPLVVADELPATGDPVTAIGYPVNVGSVSDADRLRPSFKSGTVSSTQVSRTGVPGIEVNADLSGGMSGGPTVDADGAVIGVNSSTFVDQSFNFVTDTVALESFLDQQGIDLPGGTSGTAGVTGSGLGEIGELASASAPATGTAGDWAFAAGGAALLLGAGGAYQRSRRRPVPASRPALPGRPDATRLIARPVTGPVTGPVSGPVAGRVVRGR
ncbi:S1 family peptidase [Modestobacter versicolor]|uniref:S1 family peptidase n=1 Tax=Modestobacter versicolor TaxID=429133 RepID=UPI0034E008CA